MTIYYAPTSRHAREQERAWKRNTKAASAYATRIMLIDPDGQIGWRGTVTEFIEANRPYAHQITDLLAALNRNKTYQYGDDRGWGAFRIARSPWPFVHSDNT